MFLSLNTRTILQPMEQWVITSFKAYYLRRTPGVWISTRLTVCVCVCMCVCVCVCVCETICILNSDLHKIQLALDFLECNYCVSWGVKTLFYGVLLIYERNSELHWEQHKRLTAVCLLTRILMSWLTFSGTYLKINSIFLCSSPIKKKQHWYKRNTGCPTC